MTNTLSSEQFASVRETPGVLYHGTTSALEGDTLTPGRSYGATGGYQDPHKHLGQSRKDFVSATESEETAWDFAAKSATMSVSMKPDRKRVHVLESHPDTRMGIEHVDHPELQKAYAEDRWSKPQPAGEWVAPSFKVKETLDIKPGHQGTFPTVNWNQFAPERRVDANHPGDPGRPMRGRQMRLGREMAAAEEAKIREGQGSLF